MSRRLEWVLGLTSFAAGTVDVASFAKLGGVLASAMTGNIALLGLYSGRGAAEAALGSAVALFAFFLGAGAGAWSVRQQTQQQALRFLMTAELVLLISAACLWLATGQPQDGLAGDSVITLLAFAMGLQIIGARQLNLAGVPTVVFTSTLANMATGVADSLARRIWPVPRDVWRQGAAILLYFCGAVTAGLCVALGTPAVMLLPAFAVGAALILVLRTVSPA